MPGIDKRLARYPQLYSRIGFAHEYRQLNPEELTAVLARRWHTEGLAGEDDEVALALDGFEDVGAVVGWVVVWAVVTDGELEP